MRRFLLAGIAAALMTGAATAADFPSGPAPYYNNYANPTAYSWAGWYAGANLGYEWATVDGSAGNPRGIFGGIGGGYNWQSGQFVFGGETDLNFSGADDTFANWKFANPWFGTARARFGYAMNNILVYGTGGLSYGDLNVQMSGLSESHTSIGWSAGAGMEVGLTQHWSAKVEYLYMDLGNSSFGLIGSDLDLRASTLRFGVNYRF